MGLHHNGGKGGSQERIGEIAQYAHGVSEMATGKIGEYGCEATVTRSVKHNTHKPSLSIQNG